MSDGAERAFKIAFEQVVLLDGLESDLSKYNIKILVTPEIVESDVAGRVGEWKKFTCQVKCKWSFLRPNGKIVYLNTFSGKVTHKGDFVDCMTLAIQDHYDKFLTNIISTKWWEEMDSKN